jgi:hypothetical protein
MTVYDGAGTVGITHRGRGGNKKRTKNGEQRRQNHSMSPQSAQRHLKHPQHVSPKLRKGQLHSSDTSPSPMYRNRKGERSALSR